MGALIMLEAIALVVIGAVGHVVRAKVREVSDIVDNLLMAVVVGVALFALLGEPSSENAVLYMAGGYSGGEILDWLFKPWWNQESGERG
jgi:hypothetical protein